MRPRINPACIDTRNKVYCEELYTVLYHPDVVFFKRVDAIRRVSDMAIEKGATLVILLNKSPFIEFNKYGNYTYIYQPEKDRRTSPKLKQFFINRGLIKSIAVN